MFSSRLNLNKDSYPVLSCCIRTAISNILENSGTLVFVTKNFEVDASNIGSLSDNQRSTSNLVERVEIEQTTVRNIYGRYLSGSNSNGQHLLIDFQISFYLCAFYFPSFRFLLWKYSSDQIIFFIGQIFGSKYVHVDKSKMNQIRSM